MCGIVGVISKKAYGFIAKDLQIFHELLYVDNLRGDDSTGIIGVNKYGDFYIDKAALDAHDFLKEYGSTCSSLIDMQKDGVAIIGHNRKGTVGKISDETAHPFVAKDHFAMVHNGTLYNHTQLYNTDVDSQALTLHLEHTINNPNYSLDALGDALNQVYGAYACVWYNQVTNKVQFLRNEQRPLWLAESEDSYYLSSEGGMLHWILTRNGVKYSKLEQIPTNNLHTIIPGYAKPVVVEVIPEKKYQPTPINGVGVTNTGGASTNNESTQVSKNKSKKLNRKLMGKDIEFFVDDYVEKYPFPGSDKDNWRILGETPVCCDIDHVVRADLNIKFWQLEDITEIEKRLCVGRVNQVTYDPSTKSIQIDVTNVRVHPKSNITKLTNEKTSVTIH